MREGETCPRRWVDGMRDVVARTSVECQWECRGGQKPVIPEAANETSSRTRTRRSHLVAVRGPARVPIAQPLLTSTTVVGDAILDNRTGDYVDDSNLVAISLFRTDVSHHSEGLRIRWIAPLVDLRQIHWLTIASEIRSVTTLMRSPAVSVRGVGLAHHKIMEYPRFRIPTLRQLSDRTLHEMQHQDGRYA
jgi:hypothetical protein